jgi:hypothetical protein
MLQIYFYANYIFCTLIVCALYSMVFISPTKDLGSVMVINTKYTLVFWIHTYERDDQFQI